MECRRVERMERSTRKRDNLQARCTREREIHRTHDTTLSEETRTRAASTSSKFHWS